MKHKNILFLFIFSLFFHYSFVFSAGEYVAECLDMNYVLESADLVLFGEVSNVSVKKETGGTIYTTIDFKVSSYIKGSGESNISWKQFGGTIGSETQFADGTPIFKKGEKGYVFLEKIDNLYKYLPVCGYGVTEKLPNNYSLGNRSGSNSQIVPDKSPSDLPYQNNFLALLLIGKLLGFFAVLFGVYKLMRR